MATTTAVHSEGTFTNSDGMTLYHQQWLPTDPPKAAVMLWHGLGEHSGRYQHVAEALVDAGYAVYALDHRGHGKSDGKRVYVRSYDEFLRDLVAERSWVRQQQPDVPLIVLGHSMGGNLALRHTLDHQDGLTAMVLSGPVIMMGNDISPAKAKLASIVGRVAPGLRPEALDATAISRDRAVVDRYRNDPLVYNGKITAGLAGGLIKSMNEVGRRFAELRLPVLILHGTDDRLANVEGSRQLEAEAVNAPVTAQYYEGLYHEVFNEPEQAQVIADLIAWLDGITADASPPVNKATDQPAAAKTTSKSPSKQASKSSPAKESATQQPPSHKPDAKKAAAKKPAAKKAAAKKTTRKTAATSKKAAAKKPAANKKAAAKKDAAKKPAAKKAATHTTTSTKAAANSRSATK